MTLNINFSKASTRHLTIIVILLVFYLPTTISLSIYNTSPTTSTHITNNHHHHHHHHHHQQALSGNWDDAKIALRSPDCCVVSVSGLDQHLRVLRDHFADDDDDDGRPSDLDLRARIRVKNKSAGYQDCLTLRQSVVTSSTRTTTTTTTTENDERINGSSSSSGSSRHYYDDPCTMALLELAKGVASLADGRFDGLCDDVFVRIVCATDYGAIDPMYHTDKAPLRGYVTLRGVGTEFMTRPCSPMEYLSLRSSFGKGTSLEGSVRRAEELEFIVMKGDHYDCNEIAGSNDDRVGISWAKKIWKRAEACVHRSPPGAVNGGRRRVIISLDLADGDDDREWYQANQKREWRSGMTQRKSRLVA